jgi:peroxiredoxin
MPALFPHYELLDPLGRPTFVSDVLGGRPTLLCFLRHFGCLFCFENAAELVNERDKLQSSGAQLVFIGHGNPAHAREFMNEHRLAGGVYTDPSRRLYALLELHHGMTRTLNPRSIRYARRAYQKGFRQTGIKGDPWQQGGNAAIAADGTILSLDRFEVAGELVSPGRLVNLLTKK